MVRGQDDVTLLLCVPPKGSETSLGISDREDIKISSYSPKAYIYTESLERMKLELDESTLADRDFPSQTASAVSRIISRSHQANHGC